MCTMAASVESEYDQFFLANYRCGPLPASVAKLCSLETSGTAPLPQPAEKQVTSSPSQSQKLFSLAPPPPPAPTASVGSQKPVNDIVVIDTLKEERAVDQKRPTQEELDAANPTGAVFLDDEESLLGVGAAAAAAASNVKGSTSAAESPLGAGGPRQRDGVDSDSDSEGADDQAKAATSSLEMTEPEAGNVPEVRKTEDQYTKVTNDTEGPVVFGSEGASATGAASNTEATKNSTSAAGQASTSAVKPAASSNPKAEQAALTPEKPASRADTANSLTSDTTIGGQSFQVSVPKPYPGVQLRKSMNLNDKLPRFLQDGKIVTGELDESGKWFKLGAECYLPMYVGEIKILHPVESSNLPSLPKRKAAKVVQPDEESIFSWWGCCAGAAAADVVFNGNADVLVTPGDTMRLRGASTDSAVAGSFQEPISSKQTKHTLVSPGSQTVQQSQAKKDDSAGMTQLPRHISNPIDPFSDAPDLPKRRAR